MISLTQLDQFLKKTFGGELLVKAATHDQAANGRQITGTTKINKIATGVTLCQAHLDQAIKWGANVVIYHHGFRLEFPHQVILPSVKRRFQTIFDHNLSVYGYHYALDAHPSLGNNAQIIARLGAVNTGQSYFGSWGIVAEYPQPITQTELAARCQKLFNHQVFSYLPDSKAKISRFGVCSGGARLHLENYLEIERLGLEAHITGEISESTPSYCREAGLMYYAGGHYCTEIFGIKALGDTIAQRFANIEVKFIDIPNPI